MTVDYYRRWNAEVDSRIENIITDSTAPVFPSLAVRASADPFGAELEKLKASMSNLTEAFRKLNLLGEVMQSDYVIDEEEDIF
jgi:hypothetical protein